MLRRQPILVATDRNLVSSGLQPDVEQIRGLLWAEAENVRFYAGKVVRNQPPLLMFQAGDDPIRGLSQQRDSNGTRWVWAASGADVVRWYGPSVAAIYSAPTFHLNQDSINDATQWDFVHWGDWTVMNPSLGALKIYKPADDAVTDLISDDPGGVIVNVVKIMKKLNFMLWIGYGERGTRIGWSDADNISVSVGTAENAAGSLSIDDFDTRIRTAWPLGQAIAVYAEDQMALVNYISAPYYFGQQVKLSGIGAVGKQAVTGDGANNFGVGRNGVWWTDGNTYRYIDEFLHDYLQDNVNWDQATKIVAARNDVTNCFDFYFPMGASTVLNEGWSFDPATGGWSKLPAVSMQDQRKLFDRPIVGTEGGAVLKSQADPAAASPLSLATKPMLVQVQDANAYADVHTDAFIDECELLVKDASNVQVRFESAERVEGPYEVSDWQDVLPQSATYHVGRIASGVYWKVRFRSTADNWRLNFQGFLLFGQVEGSKRGGLA